MSTRRRRARRPELHVDDRGRMRDCVLMTGATKNLSWLDVKGRPLVIGHRGYRARYPENTLDAFRAAFAAGADGVECDLQKTADGRYVVIHDPTLERTAGSGGAVSAMRLADVKQFDVGGGETVPEFTEMLAALPEGGLLDLELKDETLSPMDCPLILDILTPRIKASALMISSFEPRLLFPFKGKGVTLGLLIGTHIASLGFSRLALLLLRLRPRYINMPVQAFDVLGGKKARLFIRLLRLFGFSLLFWTVNGRNEMEAIRGFAHAIVTDEVEAVLRMRG